METRHASLRAQQRAIPPFVDRLLDEFGEEQYDGHGCIRTYFSHRSIKNMQKAFGHQPAGLLKRYTRAFKVESTDGIVVTRGWHTSRLLRR